MKHRSIKKIVAIAGLSLIAMPLSLLASIATQKANPCFFVQSADKATLTSSQLTLINFHKNTVWFADSPSSQTGAMPTSTYLNLLWGKSTSHFNQHHPNASLVGEVINPKTHVPQSMDIIIRLDGVTQKNDQLIYQVHPLSHNGALIDPKQVIYLQYPTLFIDRYICPTCD